MTATDAATADIRALFAEHWRESVADVDAADHYVSQRTTVDLFAGDFNGMSAFHERAATAIAGAGPAGELAARRIAAAFTSQGQPVPAPLRALAVAALKGEAGPAKIKFRDILIAEAVDIARRHGLKLTRNSGNENTVSACSLVADMVGRAGLASIGEKAVEHIWRRVTRPT